MLALIAARQKIPLLERECTNALSRLSSIRDPFRHVITPYILNMPHVDSSRTLTVRNIRIHMEHHQAGPLTNNLYLYSIDEDDPNKVGFTLLQAPEWTNKLAFIHSPSPDRTIVIVKDEVEYLVVWSKAQLCVYQHNTVICTIDLRLFTSDTNGNIYGEFIQADPGLICVCLDQNKQHILFDLTGQQGSFMFNPSVKYLRYGTVPITLTKNNDRYTVQLNGRSKTFKEDMNGFWLYQNYLYAGYELPACYVINMYDLTNLKCIASTDFNCDSDTVVLVGGQFMWYDRQEKTLKLKE